MKLTTHFLLKLGSRMHGTIPPPQYIFMAWCLIKHRDNFNFTFKVQFQYLLGETEESNEKPQTG
jgi:hypothetical protein